MGFISDLFTGGVSGALSSAVRGAQEPGGLRQIEGLCARLGWDIDERVGDSGICLYFKDPIVRVRKLLVTSGEMLTAFTVFSSAEFSARGVPTELAFHLLQRNQGGIFHAWQLTGPDGGKVGFAAVYTALLAGLDAITFKTICETLCKEAHALDAKLQESGLI